MNQGTPKSIDFYSVAHLYDYYVRTEFDISFWLNESKLVQGKCLSLDAVT